MKKIALSVVLLIALLGTSIAYAMETTTYSGTSQAGKWYHLPVFTTYRSGDITATAYFTPSSNAYGVYIHSMESSLYCINNVDNRSGNNFSSVSCTIPNAPAGIYEAEFGALRGKVSFILEITAETNP